jgi:predicted metal-dependent phosphoesterase TrpH
MTENKRLSRTARPFNKKRQPQTKDGSVNGQQPSARWLLCDFHIHTQWSDGSEPLENVVNLYGESGFDAICITDHLIDAEFWRLYPQAQAIAAKNFDRYLEHLWREARRAWDQFNMILIPGTEVTNQTGGYHILAIDVKQYIDPDNTVEDIIAEIHRQDGIAVACHPHRREPSNGEVVPGSRYLWQHHERYASLFDAWEVANRDDLFNAVGLKKYNYIANGDFHTPNHLFSWKTLLQCPKNTQAIKQAVRDNTRVSLYLFRDHCHY